LGSNNDNEPTGIPGASPVAVAVMLKSTGCEDVDWKASTTAESPSAATPNAGGGTHHRRLIERRRGLSEDGVGREGIQDT